MAVVVRNTLRTDLALVDGLAALGVATVHEAQGRTGLLRSDIRPIFRPRPDRRQRPHVRGGSRGQLDDPCRRRAGEARRHPGRDADEPCDDGYLGDLLAESLVAHGVRGLVIDAGVRDIATLTEMQFPVWSRAVFAQGTVKETVANVQTPIVCAGAAIRPGDVIVADDDGVVVVRREDAATVLEAGQAREANETSKRARLAAASSASTSTRCVSGSPRRASPTVDDSDDADGGATR